jgi:signal transduction histidine kinase/ActR/RegA family two-component response regulator
MAVIVFKRTLGLKITLFFLIVSLLPFTIVSALSYFQARQSTAVMLKEHLSNLASEVGVAVERTIFSAYTHIEALAENSIIKSEQTKIKDKLLEIQKIHNLYKVYDDITLVNLKGVVLASTTYDFRGDWKYKEWFQQSKTGDLVISPVHAMLYPFRLVIICTAPVMGKDGAVKAVLAGRVNMQRVWEITDRVEIGRTGFVFVTDKKGNLIAHPDKSKLLYKLTPESLLKEILTGETETIEYTNAGGVGKICHYIVLKGYQKYKGQDWRIGITQDINEAYAIVDKMRMQIMIAAVSGLVLILLLATILTRNIVKPIKALAKTAGRIAKGDLSVQATVRTKDEIGDLGSAFNRMAEGLKTTTVSRDKLAKEITERKQAEKEKEKIQAQLLQSQKMETIGTLTGGVAHHLNNMLTAIQGYAGLVMTGLDKASPLRRHMERIHEASAHSAHLIRQLLLFSRKQPMKFTSLNINQIVDDSLKMLNRLIGEDITINTELEPNLWTVRAAPTNIEQVIMNLAVNARDAMPKGGELTIKTENVTLDGKYCKVIPEARPGKFVRLSIEDTGIGMDKEIIQHIFEPFFSTKGIGKGTGLGLSTVYGIVKQHKGWINVYSEPGRGSAFKVYLPAFPGKPEHETKKMISLEELKGNGERILLVEDEERVREFIRSALTENGYIVFEATDAKEALEIFEEEKGNFHLVLSDVVLTDKSGLHLVEQLLSRKPKLRVLLSSGYTGQKSQWTIIRQRGYRFLQKPYAITDLLQAIKETVEPGE